MIAFQVISMLVLLLVIVMLYACTVKLVQEHKELHNTKDESEEQVNLALTDKQ